VDGLKARLASRNPGKVRELAHLLPAWTIEPLAADDFPPEEGETYYENARGKALFGRAHAHEGEWADGLDRGCTARAAHGCRLRDRTRGRGTRGPDVGESAARQRARSQRRSRAQLERRSAAER